METLKGQQAMDQCQKLGKTRSPTKARNMKLKQRQT